MNTTALSDPIIETSRIPAAALDRMLSVTGNDARGKINIPVNPTNWRDLALDIQPDLLWFHQHLLDKEMSLDDAALAVDYEKSVVFKVLHGRYEGSYANFCGNIRSYRKIAEGRAKIQNAEFAHNQNTRTIFDALSYAQSSNTIIVITGETGMSKTVGIEAWRAENNHGRTVIISATEITTTRGSIMACAEKVGVDKNGSLIEMRDGIHRAFNQNRMLIVDEAQNLIPSRKGGHPAALEFFRRLHDATKCGLAFVASGRFGVQMEKLHFHFEQILGRLSLNVRLFPDHSEKDLEPILCQYFARVPSAVMTACLNIANHHEPRLPGRLRSMVEILRLTSKIAGKDKTRPTEAHFFKAIALRKQLSGFTQNHQEDR